MKYKATLYNANCAFDSVILSNVKGIKEWAKHRGGSYTLDVDSVYNVLQGLDGSVQFSVKNNRFYEIKK